jgi:hypothetical protein
LGEILPGVINDLIGSQGFYKFYICSAAYPGHFRPKVPGKLYRSTTDRSRSAVNQDFLSALDVSLISKEKQRGNRPIRNGGGFIKA